MESTATALDIVPNFVTSLTLFSVQSMFVPDIAVPRESDDERFVAGKSGQSDSNQQDDLRRRPSHSTGRPVFTLVQLAFISVSPIFSNMS